MKSDIKRSHYALFRTTIKTELYMIPSLPCKHTASSRTTIIPYSQLYFQKNSVRQIHKAIIQSPLARAVDIGKIVHHHKD